MSTIQESDCNIGIRYLGFPLIKTYMENLKRLYANRPNTVFISIGSGLGQLEYVCKDRINWICIDSSPESYKIGGMVNGEVYIPPHYPTIQECLKRHPEYIGNCVLLLNWTPPTSCDSEGFEHEAILLSKPIGICSIFEVYRQGNGAAGSKYFYDLYQNAVSIKERLALSAERNRTDKKRSLYRWKKIEDNYGYRIVTDTKIYGNRPFDTIHITILHKVGVNISTLELEPVKEYHISTYRYVDPVPKGCRMFSFLDDSDSDCD